MIAGPSLPVFQAQEQPDLLAADGRDGVGGGDGRNEEEHCSVCQHPAV